MKKNSFYFTPCSFNSIVFLPRVVVSNKTVFFSIKNICNYKKKTMKIVEILKKNFTLLPKNVERKMDKWKCNHCFKEIAYQTTRMAKHLSDCVTTPENIKHLLKKRKIDDSSIEEENAGTLENAEDRGVKSNKIIIQLFYFLLIPKAFKNIKSKRTRDANLALFERRKLKKDFLKIINEKEFFINIH